MDWVNGTLKVANNTLSHCMNMHQTQDNGVRMFFQIVFITEMTVGLPGSLLALWIFCFRMKAWKPHVLFLFNLLLADFLLLISVPFRIDTHLRGDAWVLGPIWCTINLFMLTVNRSASLAFMTVVALDRYFKVVHPHHCVSRITPRQAGWLAGLIWIVVILLRIPLLTTSLLHQDGNVSRCRSFHSYEVLPLAMKVHYAAYIAEFFLPWFLLLFCTAQIALHLHQRQMNRMKRVQRAIRAVVVITSVFTFCFMPSVITGLLGMHLKAFHPMACMSYHRISQLFMMCISLTYLNSALDPIVYFFSSSVFRVALKNSICCKKNARPGHEC